MLLVLPQVVEAGHLNAVVFWFDLHLDEEVSLTTAPAYIGLGGQPLAAGGGPSDPSVTDADSNPLRTKGRAALQRMGAPEPDQAACPAPSASAADSFQPALVRVGCIPAGLPALVIVVSKPLRRVSPSPWRCPRAKVAPVLACRQCMSVSVQEFTGERSGWVFKLGDQGLGYYEEHLPDKDKAAVHVGSILDCGEKQHQASCAISRPDAT